MSFSPTGKATKGIEGMAASERERACEIGINQQKGRKAVMLKLERL